MGDISSGERLLALREIFFYETDENHQLSIKGLIEKLTLAFGPEYHFDQRAVKRDIKTLQAAGFDIIENIEKFGEIKYSHQDRLFESYQLRLLIDPILSARFITEDEKKNLVSQLKKLTSQHLAKTFPDPIVYHQSINSDYQLIKLHIDQIHQAMTESKMISFQYGDFNINKDFKLRHEGDHYQIKPYALIWESNFYYLIGEDIKYDDTKNPRHYRLDRMRNVAITDEKFIKEQRDISAYVQHTFHMFSGDDQWIKIQFDNSALNGVIDKFGREADVKRIDDKTFLLKAKAKSSLGLKSWIMSWGSRAKVLSPQTLVEDINKELRNMIEVYEK